MKYHGNVGYSETLETKPGLYEEKLRFIEYKGDVIKTVKKDLSDNEVNQTITVRNQISIVADPYARANFVKIRCVEWQGALWSVTEVDAGQPPRLILYLGGIYHEDLERITDDTPGDNGSE